MWRRMKATMFYFAVCQVQSVTILSTAGFLHLRPCCHLRRVVNVVDKSQAGVHGFSFHFFPPPL